MSLDQDIKTARELGFESYGKYMASKYDPTAPMAAPKKKKQNRRPRKFTDQEAFALWQSHMTDAEIAGTLGVSRAYIQRWRDQLELPSTAKTQIDTKKFRLAQLQDGTAVVLSDDI